MKTLGIDLASQPANTAACLIGWSADHARVLTCEEGCDDTQLDALIAQADVVGIDAPFGWPLAFTEAVQKWTHAEWNTELRDRMRFRLTDRVLINRKDRNRPLSVSTDQIALPAMRAMALLKRHEVTDRSGDGRFYEVYPAAALRAWDLPANGYKKDDIPSRERRDAILKGLRVQMPWLLVDDSVIQSADRLDSLLASLITRAAKQGHTTPPEKDQQDQAKQEGWIHVPNRLPSLIMSS